MKAAAIIIYYLVFISYTITRAQNDGERPPFNGTVHRECMERNGIKWGMIKQRNHNNVSEYGKTLSCLKACRAQGMGLMNGSSINYEQLNLLLDKTAERCDMALDTRKTIHDCLSNVDETADECTVGAKCAGCILPKLHSCFFEGGRGRMMRPHHSTTPPP